MWGRFSNLPRHWVARKQFFAKYPRRLENLRYVLFEFEFESGLMIIERRLMIQPVINNPFVDNIIRSLPKNDQGGILL